MRHLSSRPLRPLALALAMAALAGCATVMGEPDQRVSIQTVDAEGRPVEGMSCRVSSGPNHYFGVTPMFNVKVRRSAEPLLVECRGDRTSLARAVLMPRADRMAPVQMLLPGGTSMMVVDHFSGYMYSYPNWIRLQTGTDMVFDRRDERGRDPTPGLITRQFDDYVRYASGATARTE
jgi:hypothetical protein